MPKSDFLKRRLVQEVESHVQSMETINDWQLEVDKVSELELHITATLPGRARRHFYIRVRESL